MTGFVSGVMTLLLLIVFLGIVFWAYSKRNTEAFDAMARLPLEDEAKEKENEKDKASKETSHE